MNWNFQTYREGDIPQGIRDGDIDDFDKTRYQSIIRESIQNSLDAKLDETLPVIVNFNFFNLDKVSEPNLFNIENHIKECLNHCQGKDDKERINKMISSFEKETVKCLEISDENTIGMDNESYGAFISKGISYKRTIESAGSKGRGKAAYFALSYLRTLLISSLTEEDYIFQGVTRLANHKINNEEKIYAGFYGKNFKVEKDKNLIPKKFLRKNRGTSIFIIGIWNDNNIIETMIEAVLNHFWLAIYEKELIVNINGEIINAEFILNKLHLYFHEIKESGRYNDHGNPRQYFETFLNGTRFSEKIDGIGDVEFRILKNDSYGGRISHFRKSKMLIYKSPELYSGYCAVFLCNGKEGNEILKKLENATHTEWKKGNWNDNPYEGKIILDKIKDFKKKCIDSFYGANKESEFNIPEFDNLISLFEKKPSAKIPKPISKIENSSPKILDKNILNLFSYVVELENGKPIYQLEIETIKKLNSVYIEVSVATDGDNMKINILNCDKGKFKKNTLKLNLEIGKNTIKFVLDDFLKHSIYYKQLTKYEI